MYIHNRMNRNDMWIKKEICEQFRLNMHKYARTYMHTYIHIYTKVTSKCGPIFHRTF
jgi:hypothetical protein